MKLLKMVGFVLVFAILTHMFAVGGGHASDEFKLNVNEHVFKNGLKALILEKRGAPIVSLRIIYKVGSANERTGITGVSHLFEHLMFKGSEIFGTRDYKSEKPLLDKEDELLELLTILKKEEASKETLEKVGKFEKELAEVRAKLKELSISDEIWSIYPTHGASGLNASTSKDTTTYYCNLPANKMELWAFIESDRMKNMVLREFYSERDVVMEERRLRTDNSPSGRLFEQLSAVSFSAHPYKWPIIGWMSDIEKLTRMSTAAYFKKYYCPNNAVIIVVGDVDTDETIKLIDKYFGDAQSQSPPPPVETVEPPQLGEKRLYVEYDASPQIAIAYHVPAVGEPDQYAMDVIEAILSRGRTSRLYKSLIDEKHIAVSANAYSGPYKYPGNFIFFATPRQPHTAEEVEKAIYDEIEKLKTNPVTDWELQKIKNQISADFVRSMESNSGLASTIAHFESIYNWRYINSYVDKTLAVTKDDIMRVAKKYFTKSNRTVGILEKKEGA